MRLGHIRKKAEAHEESVFIPMTDMTVSFLFIVMILLAFFAVQIDDDETVPALLFESTELKALALEKEVDRLTSLLETKEAEILELASTNTVLASELQGLDAENEALETMNPMEHYILNAQEKRLDILQKVQSELKSNFPGLLVEISPENDALRFKGEGLFDTGSRYLRADKRELVSDIAHLIASSIECYTLNTKHIAYEDCNPNGLIVEAVQVEGHTDSDGSDEHNILLSTGRANAAYFAMLDARDDLLDYRNIRNQPVLSVAGYGEMRPIASNETQEGKAQNRRIDLRLIMYTPHNRLELDDLQHALSLPDPAQKNGG